MPKRIASRRAFLKTLGLGAAALATVPVLAAPERKPNILMILVDDLGYGDLSSYGAPDLKTPHIDGLVAKGMRFDNFYANCPVCSPTRASLLTGRYPDMAGVPGVIRTIPTWNFGRLDPGAVLLPAVLGRASYETAIVGKWHLGLQAPDTPLDRGFDRFQGFLGDMMEDYYTHLRHGENYMRSDRETIDPKGHATDLFSEWAVDCIRKQAQSEKPFFLYLAYNAPHTPIQPPEAELERVRRREPEMSLKRAKLVALIEHLDAGIGRVLAALEESGQAGNTLVVFTSDNGGEVDVGARNGALSGTKGQMSEGGIREPMCAVWPGRIAPGSRSERVALTMDLYPTLCQAAGAAFDHEIDGRTILPTWLGEAQPEEERTLFWMRREAGGGFGGRAIYAARRGDWKLLQNTPFERPRLYNLKDDPLEERPVDEKHQMYAELFEATSAHIIRAGAVPWQ